MPEWLPRIFNDMASGVLKLDMGRRGVVEDEQMACYANAPEHGGCL